MFTLVLLHEIKLDASPACRGEHALPVYDAADDLDKSIPPG
jgi:hypothetical protein